MLAINKILKQINWAYIDRNMDKHRDKKNQTKGLNIKN